MTTTTAKYKPGDKVVVLNLKVNDSYMDITGTVTRYILDRKTRVFKVEVYINETWLILEEDRIISYEQWQPKPISSSGK